MKCRVFAKIINLVGQNINLSCALCRVNVYLCSVSGLLKYARSGLTSFSGFRCVALVSYASHLITSKKRDFNIRCFSYYKLVQLLHSCEPLFKIVRACGPQPARNCSKSLCSLKKKKRSSLGIGLNPRLCPVSSPCLVIEGCRGS